MNATETHLFPPTPQVKQQAKQHLSGFWQLLTLLRSHFWWMTLTIGAGILYQGMTLAGAALGAYLVGLVVVARSLAPLQPVLVVLGLLVLGRAVMAWVEPWLAHDLAYRILDDIRGRLYWSLEQLAPSYLLDRRSGDIAAAAMGDAETLEWFYAHTVGVSLATLIILAVIHWALALVLLPWIALVIAVPFWFTQWAARQGKMRNKSSMPCIMRV